MFNGGIGLRQICDWCRLLWIYRKSLNHGLLESRIRKMGLMTEWKVFATMAVEFLDMPAKAMPFYENKYAKKANRVLSFILESGNFGHNKDISYQRKYSGLIRKSITVLVQAKDNLKLARIFPMDAIRFFTGFVFLKSKSVT